MRLENRKNPGVTYKHAIQNGLLSITVFNYLYVRFIYKLNFLKIRLVLKYGPRGHKTGGRLTCVFLELERFLHDTIST